MSSLVTYADGTPSQGVVGRAGDAITAFSTRYAKPPTVPSGMTKADRLRRYAADRNTDDYEAFVQAAKDGWIDAQQGV